MLVESLDRLSREKVGEAIERLKLILNHGIDVITLCDNTVYNIDSLNEPYLDWPPESPDNQYHLNK